MAQKVSFENRVVELMAEWARLGVLFNTSPVSYKVDLEELVVKTASVGRMEERLLVMAASWLAVHFHLLDARRLGRKLEEQSDETSAVVGVMLSLALKESPNATQLRAAVGYCTPLTGMQPLYFVFWAYPELLNLVKEESLGLFEEWGFWHNDEQIKLDAIRPVSWIVRQCSEMFVRALVGPGLDLELIDLLSESPKTVTEIGKATRATYAATHASAMRLLGRGLIRRGSESPKELYLNSALSRLLVPSKQVAEAA